MSRFANPVPPERPETPPTIVGWKADAEKERRRGRPQAAALQEPCGCPRKRRVA